MEEGVIIEQFNARGRSIANCFRGDQPFLLSTDPVLLSHGTGSQGEAYDSLVLTVTAKIAVEDADLAGRS